METTIDGGVGGPVIVDGADGGGRGVARHSDVSIARARRAAGDSKTRVATQVWVGVNEGHGALV